MPFLFKNQNKSPNVWVLESMAEKHDGRVIIRAGARMQEMGRLFRTRSIVLDLDNMNAFRDEVGIHKDNIRELASMLGDMLDWCDDARKTPYDGPGVSCTRVLEQEWPIMFYATCNGRRVELNIYGKDLNNCRMGFKRDSNEAWYFFKSEIVATIDNFWSHLDDIDSINLKALVEGN